MTSTRMGKSRVLVLVAQRFYGRGVMDGWVLDLLHFAIAAFASRYGMSGHATLDSLEESKSGFNH